MISGLIITDFTSVKKWKLDFQQLVLELPFADISTVLNQYALNDIVHVRRYLFDISNIYLFKVHNENSRTKSKVTKLTITITKLIIEAPERHQ